MLPVLTQKWMFRGFLILCLISFLSIFIYAYHTEVSGGPQQEIAPFYEEFVGDPQNGPGEADLTRPHRTSTELQNWVSLAVSEGLMLDARNYTRQVAAVRGHYSADGYEDFQTYLTEADLQKTLEASDLRVSMIVEQPPLLLNEGVVGDSYRWLFQMPVTVSYTPRLANEYRPGDTANARKLTIRVQIGRYQTSAEDEHGLKIESFSVLPRRD